MHWPPDITTHHRERWFATTADSIHPTDGRDASLIDNGHQPWQVSRTVRLTDVHTCLTSGGYL
jgi:hypothetical protein